MIGVRGCFATVAFFVGRGERVRGRGFRLRLNPGYWGFSGAAIAVFWRATIPGFGPSGLNPGYTGAFTLPSGTAMSAAALPPAINLHAWIDAHRDQLKPPVGNRCIVDGDFIVMVVAGPNARTDFHYEHGPELFYQIEGEMCLRLQHDDGIREVPIRAGELFYLPPKVWHSPQRAAGSIGLVIERKRLPHERDALAWFCPKCNHLLHQQPFALDNIETDLPPLFARFHASPALRRCGQCGHLHPAPEPQP